MIVGEIEENHFRSLKFGYKEMQLLLRPKYKNQAIFKTLKINCPIEIDSKFYRNVRPTIMKLKSYGNTEFCVVLFSINCHKVSVVLCCIY